MYIFELFSNGNNIIKPEVIEGEVVYITWKFTPTGDSSYFGTDSFVVQNENIAYQTIASTLYDKYEVV